jgi:hypothetical protein
MSIKTLVLRSCELLVCALAALYAAGCGGSVFSADGDAGAGGSAAGASAGSTGSAGASVAGSSAAGASGAASGGSSGAASGGSSGGGASGSGGCTAPVACPAIACADGYKFAQSAGDCCPTCVPDSDACTQDQAGYDSLRQTLLQSMSALACKTDNDCTRLTGNAQCGDVCSGSPVNVTSAPSINSQLGSYAADHCSTCIATYPPCALPPAVVCSNAVCVAGMYL